MINEHYIQRRKKALDTVAKLRKDKAIVPFLVTVLPLKQHEYKIRKLYRLLLIQYFFKWVLYALPKTAEDLKLATDDLLVALDTSQFHFPTLKQVFRELHVHSNYGKQPITVVAFAYFEISKATYNPMKEIRRYMDLLFTHDILEVVPHQPTTTYQFTEKGATIQDDLAIKNLLSLTT